MRTRAAAFVVCVTCIAAVACGGDDSSPEIDPGSSGAETDGTSTTTTTTTTMTSMSTSTSTSTTSTSTTTEITSTTGSSSSTGDPSGSTSDPSASSTGTGARVCDDDASEPNNIEDQATDLGNITDADGTGSSIEGVLDGAADADWFTVHIEDTGLAFLTPLRALRRDGPGEMCKYFRCDADPENTSVTCDGTTEDVLMDGTPGCCTEGADLSLGVECIGADESGTVTIRLTTAAEQCVGYTLDYSG